MATQWKDLSSRQRTAVKLAGGIQLGLTALALTDIARRPAAQIRGSRKLWTLAALVNFIGPICYFLIGRRR